MTLSYSNNKFSTTNDLNTSKTNIINEKLNLEQNLYEIKTQIQNLKSEKIQLRSSIVKKRQYISQRDLSINKALSETKENQKIITASINTINNLKNRVQYYLLTKEKLIEDLNNIKNSDQYWKSIEKEIEIKILFQEYNRIKKENNFYNIKLKNLEKEVLNLNDYILNKDELIKQISNIEKENKELNEKIFQYQKNKLKNEIFNNNEQLIQEINKLELSISCEELSIKKYDENREKSLKELDKIIIEIKKKILNYLN